MNDERIIYSMLESFKEWKLKNHIKQLLKLKTHPKERMINRYLKSIPKYLFHFQPSNQICIKTFRNREIYLSTAESKKWESKDSIIEFDMKYKQKAIRYLKKRRYEFGRLVSINYLKQRNVEFDSDDYIYSDKFLKELEKNSYSNQGIKIKEDIRKQLFRNGVKGVNDINRIIKQVESFWRKDDVYDKIDFYIKKSTEELNRVTRSRHHVFCFTEVFDDDQLWNSFGKSGDGFVTIYSFHDYSFGEAFSNFLLITPVYYGKRRKYSINKMARLLIKNMRNPNKKSVDLDAEVQFGLQVRTKHVRYRYEKEWRLVIREETIKKDFYLRFPYIKGIIIGHLVSAENRKELITIAEEQGYTIYEQSVNGSIFEYRLVSGENILDI